MDLKEQKYVCTLAECKSDPRLRRLYISQPALSLYINNVEKILGARLFERNGRKFELTWLGKQYVEKASQMLELERQFEAVRRQTERENAGQVRIGIAQRRGIWFLPAVLSVYEREWPQVDVVIREGNLADLTIMLKNRELDLVVLSERRNVEIGCPAGHGRFSADTARRPPAERKGGPRRRFKVRLP